MLCLCACCRADPLSLRRETVQIKCVFVRMCTLRTSFPRGIPLPRAQVKPMTLATNVLKVRYSFSTTPLRMVFISGMPDPVTRQRRSRRSGCRERCDCRPVAGEEREMRRGTEDREAERRRTGLISIQVVSAVRGASEAHYNTTDANAE